MQRCDSKYPEPLDGTAPHWRLVYANPRPRHSETGLRGLTAVPNPSGNGEVLLAAAEGEAVRIIRVDPSDGSEATDLDVENVSRRSVAGASPGLSVEGHLQ